MQQAYPGPPGGYGTNTAAPVVNPTSSPGSTAATGTATTSRQGQHGGRFDFDDGGTYCGGWEDGKAHGHGVCTGPKGQGAYSGSWNFGFEVSGVYTWPSGSAYEGQWQNGKRHGLGVESRGRWIYRGEWTQGFKGRYGIRQSTTSAAKYEGTWANGLQDGYGSETYADGGTYQGQWLRGMRHGYGVRASAPFGLASHYRPKQTLRASLTSLRSNEAAGTSGSVGADASAIAAERDRRIDDARGGFVLKSKSDEPPQRRRSLVEKSLKKSILSGLKMRKQRSTGDLEQRVTSAGSMRSTASTASWVSTESSHSPVNGGSLHTDSNASFVVEDEHMDGSITETYMGEWKNDKRSGFGISERSDGLRYEGEWFNNKKYGYGVTILRDGSREEGKYKNNVLITSQKKKHIFLMRSAKFRERIDAAVNAAQRASKIALQKADIAISRMSTARSKAEMADSSAYQARDDFENAKMTAKQYSPDFTQPCLEKLYLKDLSKYKSSIEDKYATQNSQQYTIQTNEQYPTDNTHLYGAPNVQNRTTNIPQSMIRSSNEQLSNSQMNEIPSSNPPLPPRGQTPQPFQYRPAKPFQPSSEYTHNESQPSPSYQQNYKPQNSQYTDNRRNADIPYEQNYAARYQSGAEDIQMKQNSIDHSQIPYKPQNYHNHSQLHNKSIDQNQLPFYNVNSQQHSRLTHSDHIPPQRPSDLNYSKKPLVPNNFYHNNSSQYQNTDSPSPQHSNPISENTRGRSFDMSTHQTNTDKYAYTNRISSTGDNDSYHRNITLRRNSKLVSSDSPYSFKQAMSDHFDHYSRPPSRDSSVGRYERAASRLSGDSRQPSIDRVKHPSVEPYPMENTRNGSFMRASTPITGNGSIVGKSMEPMLNTFNNRNPLTTPVQSKRSALPFEEIILRKRSLGQDILPSPIGQPKRTESLYNPGTPQRKDSQNKVPVTLTSLQRKKSLPDFQGLPKSTIPMSREEVSVLSSARREEVRRSQQESDRLRANPLLYLVSPHVKDWFSRQQLLIVILFVNILLAIIFYKLLTS